MAGSHLLPDMTLIRLALKGLCPSCRKTSIFTGRFLSMDIKKRCEECGLKLEDHDIGDGPAVFMIFILGFSLVPMALFFEKLFAPPLWVHGVLWGIVALAMTLGGLRPLKAYIIALQYKHRPGDWQKKKSQE